MRALGARLEPPSRSKRPRRRAVAEPDPPAPATGPSPSASAARAERRGGAARGLGGPAALNDDGPAVARRVAIERSRSGPGRPWRGRPGGQATVQAAIRADSARPGELAAERRRRARARAGRPPRRPGRRGRPGPAEPAARRRPARAGPAVERRGSARIDRTRRSSRAGREAEAAAPRRGRRTAGRTGVGRVAAGSSGRPPRIARGDLEQPAAASRVAAGSRRGRPEARSTTRTAGHGPAVGQGRPAGARSRGRTGGRAASGPARSAFASAAVAGREDQGVAGPGRGDVEEAEGLGVLLGRSTAPVDRPAERAAEPRPRRPRRPRAGSADRPDERAELRVEGDEVQRAGSACGSRSGRTTIGNSSPLAWWIDIRRTLVAVLVGRGGLLLARRVAQVGAEPGDEVGRG